MILEKKIKEKTVLRMYYRLGNKKDKSYNFHRLGITFQDKKNSVTFELSQCLHTEPD